MKRAIYISTFVLITTLVQAKEFSWSTDTLIGFVLNHPSTIKKSDNYHLYFQLETSDSENWEVTQEFYGKKKRKLKRQYVFHNRIPCRFEKWFSRKGEVTHVFDHDKGIQLFGEELSYYNFRMSARTKADSIVRQMFSNTFFQNHIMFCSSCIYLDYHVDESSFKYSVQFFEEIPKKPASIRFYYPFYFTQDHVFTRQLHIELDSSLNVVSTWPLDTNMNDYEFNIDYEQACEIAVDYGFSPQQNVDIANEEHVPFLTFRNDDYSWCFAKQTSLEETSVGSTEKGIYLIINAKTAEVSNEDYEIIGTY